MDERARHLFCLDAVRFAKAQFELRPDAKQALILSPGVRQ